MGEEFRPMPIRAVTEVNMVTSIMATTETMDPRSSKLEWLLPNELVADWEDGCLSQPLRLLRLRLDLAVGVGDRMTIGKTLITGVLLFMVLELKVTMEC